MKLPFLSLAILMLMLLSYSKVNAAEVLSDSFTATNGTELNSYNSNWVNVSGEAEIQNNELTASSPVARYYWDGDYYTDDYTVCSDVKFIQSATNNFYLQYIKSNTSYNTWYRYYVQGNGTNSYTITLGKSLSGSESTLDSDSISATDNSVHEICISSIEDNLSVTYDSSEVLSATDSSISSGYAAIYQGDFPIDNFTINNTLSETTTIVASPSSSNINVGSQFPVDVVVGASEPFNAVRANVTVSSNLEIIGIQNPSTNSCNLSYTQNPTVSNPSFAGGIYGTYETECVIYKLILSPTATGTGTITFSNSSVKSYSDNSEILDSVDNGSFTIGNGPTPTPTPILEFNITNPAYTYSENFTLYGSKLSTIANIFVDGEDSNSSYPTSTSWESDVTLSLGENEFILYGDDGNGNQTATQGTIVNLHSLGDINGDGDIDLIDASLFAVDWDKTESLVYVLSDMNGDEVVDLTDLSILAKLIE